MRSVDYSRFLLLAGARTGGTTLTRFFDEIGIDILFEPQTDEGIEELFCRCQAARLNTTVLSEEVRIRELEEAVKLGVKLLYLKREDFVRQGVSFAIYRKWNQSIPYEEFCEKHLVLTAQEVSATIDAVRDRDNALLGWIEAHNAEVHMIYYENLYLCKPEKRDKTLEGILAYIGIEWEDQINEKAERLFSPKMKTTSDRIFNEYANA